MNMGKFEDSVNGAIQNGIIPGLVVCAENRDGTSVHPPHWFDNPSDLIILRIRHLELLNDV